MIKVIMDTSNKEKLNHYRDLGYEINLDVLNSRQDKTWHQVNWSMILSKSTSAIILDIEKGYSDTKSMIIGALKNNVPVVVLLRGQRFNLNPAMIYESNYRVVNGVEKYLPNELTTLLNNVKDIQQDAMEEKDCKDYASSLDYIKSNAKLLSIDLPALEIASSYVNQLGRDFDITLDDEKDEEEVYNKYITLMYYKKLDLECFNQADKVQCPVCGHWTRRTNALYGMLQCSFCCTDIIEEAGITIEYFGKESLYEDDGEDSRLL